MREMYFNYIISQCQMPGISRVCSVYKKKQELVKAAEEEFLGIQPVCSDWRLISALNWFFHDGTRIQGNALSRDAKAIYDRCSTFIHGLQSALQRREELDYNDVFNVLTDCNWLLSSIHVGNEGENRIIPLLWASDSIITGVREHLLQLYNEGIRHHNECVYMDEAIAAKRRFFSGLYPFQYPESQKYMDINLTISNIESMKKEATALSTDIMAMFYGLTATAMQADEITRGFRK